MILWRERIWRKNPSPCRRHHHPRKSMIQGPEVSATEHMSLVDHLTELRYRLIKAFQGIILGVGVGVYFSEEILSLIRKPVLQYLGPMGGLVFTGVMDKFMAHLKVGVLGGVIMTCPYWLYHVWAFIAPGLYKHERRYAAGFIFVW